MFISNESSKILFYTLAVPLQIKLDLRYLIKAFLLNNVWKNMHLVFGSNHSYYIQLPITVCNSGS